MGMKRDMLDASLTFMIKLALDNDTGNIIVTPYTEGFNDEHEPFILEFPFTKKEWNETLDEAEDIASRQWDCINYHLDDCECCH